MVNWRTFQIVCFLGITMDGSFQNRRGPSKMKKYLPNLEGTFKKYVVNWGTFQIILTDFG